jgi:hypothetical protein
MCWLKIAVVMKAQLETLAMGMAYLPLSCHCFYRHSAWVYIAFLDLSLTETAGTKLDAHSLQPSFTHGL